MIKPLEALDMIVWRLTSHEDDLKLRATDEKEVNIIQEALKRLEKLEKENQDLKDKLNSEALDNWQLHCKYGKYKKTIEILKDKSVDIVCLQLCFKHYNVEYYNNELSNYLPYFMVVKCQLTQEEYDLLKEVLE